jgi:hypothetical protein
MRASGLDRRFAPTRVTGDGVEDPLNHVLCIAEAGGGFVRAKVRENEQRRAERDERDGRDDGNEQALSQAHRSARARLEQIDGLLRRAVRNELHRPRHGCSHRDVRRQRSHARHRPCEEHELELRREVVGVRAQDRQQRRRAHRERSD